MRKKSKRRKIHPGRLFLVLGVSAIVLTALSASGYYFYKQIVPANASDQTLAQSQQELSALTNDIELAFCKQSLTKLQSELETRFNREENYLTSLSDQIQAYLEQNGIAPDQISWAIQDLQTDVYIESDNAKEDFVAASTYKLPLMMLWFEKIAAGEAKWEDTFKLTRDMLEKEDEENPDQPIGKKYNIDEMVPLSELLQAASIYSDNLAGHMLFANIGGYSEYKTQALKYSSTPQSAAFTDDHQNVLNAHYTMDLAHYLYTTPDVFDNLKYWLMLGGYEMFLNKNEQRGYIQKLGNIDEVRNVIGYYPGEFPFSISIYSRVDKDRGEQIIADLGDITFQYFQDLYYSGFYTEAERVRDPQYAAWEIYGNTPGNVFWEFDMDTPNKANSKENIAAIFGM